MSEAKKVTPAGDTARRVADAINHNASLLNVTFLQPRTVAQLAAEQHEAGRQFLCTNEVGGSVPVFSDGLVWRRCTDRAIAS